MKKISLFFFLPVLLLLSCQEEAAPPLPDTSGIQALTGYRGGDPLLQRLSHSLSGNARAQEALGAIFETHGSPKPGASFTDRPKESLKGSASGTDDVPAPGLLVLPLVEEGASEVKALLTYDVSTDSVEYLKLYTMATLESFTEAELLTEEVRTLALTFLAVQYRVDGTDEVAVNGVVYKRKAGSGSTNWTIVKECQDWAIYVGDDPDPVTGTNCEYEIQVEEDDSVELLGEGSGSGSGEGVVSDTTQAAKPCAGDPVKDPEVAAQTVTGLAGGMYGCARNGTGCKAATDSTTAKKYHDGIDLKNDYGDPVYAMYGGTIYTAKYDEDGAGYYTRIQSTVDGKTFLTEYFHLQKDNRVTTGSVSAGDIIGYQGDSGSLKKAINNGETVSHVHIQVREHDGSTKWGFNNYTLVEPKDYLTTEISDTGTVTEEAGCATEEQTKDKN